MVKREAHVLDMTQGNVLKLILLFSVPILIGNVFQQVYNLVDTFIAGRCLGDHGIAAMGATSSINSLIIGFASGICSGFAILVAHAFGAREGLKRAVALMSAELFAVAIVFTALSLCFLRSLLSAMDTPASIFDDAYTYIFVILAGIPVTLLYNYGASILRSLGNSRAPLFFLVIGCLVNIGLDVLLTGVLSWGILGLAVATVIAQFVSAVCSVVYLFVRYPEVRFSLSDLKAGARAYGDMFVTGFFMGAMTVIYDIGSVMLQSAINGLGDQVITAHTAARKILSMLMQPLITLGTACATFAGQNYGAKRYARIQKGLLQTCLCSLVWSAVVFVVLLSFGGDLVVLISDTKDEEVVRLAVMNLTINAPFYFPLGFIFPLRMGLQGFNHKIIPVLSGSIEMGVKVLGKYLLVPKFGYVGASFAEPSTWLLCGVFLLICFLYVVRTDLKPKIKNEKREKDAI